MGSLRHSPTPILRPIFRTLSERPTVKQDKDLLGRNVLSKCLLFYIYVMPLASKRILNNAYLALLLMFSKSQFRTNIPATTDAKTRGETKPVSCRLSRDPSRAESRAGREFLCDNLPSLRISQPSQVLLCNVKECSEIETLKPLLRRAK